MPHYSYCFIPLFCIALFAGCTSIERDSTQQVQPIQLPSTFADAGMWLNSPSKPPSFQAAWWTVYNDAQLDQLMQQLDQNPNIQAAASRYRAAQATLAQNQAGRQAQVNTNFSAIRGNTSTTSSNKQPESNVYQMNNTVNWEWDLWDKIASRIQAAEEQSLASEADWRALALSTQALVVNTYLQWLIAHHQQQLQQNTIQAFERFLALTEARKRAGVATQLDVAQAKTELLTANAQLLSIQESIQRHELSLQTLIGQAQTNALARPDLNSLPKLIQLPPLIPAVWLRQRPDIIAAEHRINAAKANIGLAESAYYPNITLSASANYRQTSLDKLINLPNTLWSFGPSLAYQLWDGGARKAQQEIAVANLDTATAEYKQTLLNAFQEVQENLYACHQLEQTILIQQTAVTSAEEAWRIAQSQYRAGINNALQVINAQTVLFSAQQNHLTSRLRLHQAQLTLLKNSVAPMNITLSTQASSS